MSLENDKKNQDTYDVISEGQILPGFSKKRVSDNLQLLFKKDKESIASIISGKPIRVKSKLKHQEAYSFQQVLSKAGLKARINRIPAQEQTIDFSLVPEGEENTPYQELAERHKQGETVVCKHCKCEQKIAPYCSECGKQLIAKAGAMPPEVTVGTSYSLTRLFSVIVIILILIIGLWWFI